MKKIIIIVIMIVMFLFISNTTKAKQISEYLGEWRITSYSASDNTPAETHITASGAYAIVGWTCAVDMHIPIAPMGSILKIEGFGIRKVQDVGNLTKYGDYRRAVDIFIGDNDKGFLVNRKVWLIREETEKEKRIREKKERKIKQKRKFNLIYNPALLPWQIVTDADIIPSGAVFINWHKENLFIYQWLDVVNSKKGLGNVIYIGDKNKIIKYREIELLNVVEDAIG